MTFISSKLPKLYQIYFRRNGNCFLVRRYLHWLIHVGMIRRRVYERTGDLSFPNLRFRSTTWGHFSNFNNLKVVGDIKNIFSPHKHIGKQLTSGVGFKWLSWLCSKWEHFEKKESKSQVFNAGKLGHFWKSAKNHLTLTKCCDQKHWN